MNISGASPVTPVARPDDSLLSLRLNQHITAEVMQVTGERVVLSVDGVQIVARLSPGTEAAGLARQKFAQFVVRDLSGSLVRLQWVDPAAGAPTSAGAPPTAGLAASLLQTLGLPTSEQNLQIAGALLAQGLPVTPELVEELARALADYDPTAAATQGRTLAQLAAALRALGLPLSPGTLNLAQAQPGPLAEAIRKLRERLEEWIKARPASSNRSLIESALAQLAGMEVDCEQPAEAIADHLRRAIAASGRSLEHELGSGREVTVENSLLALASLRGELAGQEQAGGPVEEIDRFLEGMRARQLRNAGEAPLQERWICQELALRLPWAGKGEPVARAARLWVACKAGGGAEPPGGGLLRLVLQVALEPGKTLEADLSIANHRVGMRLTASTPGLLAQAAAGSAALAAALEGHGFHLNSLEYRQDEPSFSPHLEAQPARHEIHTVNRTV